LKDGALSPALSLAILPPFGLIHCPEFFTEDFAHSALREVIKEFHVLGNFVFREGLLDAL
jgi:hypothetical protein